MNSLLLPYVQSYVLGLVIACYDRLMNTAPEQQVPPMHQSPNHCDACMIHSHGCILQLHLISFSPIVSFKAISLYGYLTISMGVRQTCFCDTQDVYVIAAGVENMSHLFDVVI